MATNPTISYIRGDTCPIAVTLLKTPVAPATVGLPHDISLASKATLSVRATIGGAYILQLSATIPITPGTDGIVVFPAPTAIISAGLTPGSMLYDVELQFSAGVVIWTPINQGAFIVSADITIVTP